MGIGVSTSVGITTRRQRRAKMGLVFVLTSTGDGSGVSTLTMTPSENTLITLDGAGKFYSDAGGTADESATWLCTTGAARTIYLKVTTGTSNMTISGDTITSWGGVWSSGWVSAANAASIAGDISRLTSLTTIWIEGNNTLSGNVSGLSSIVYLAVTGSNTLSGSVAGLSSMQRLYVAGSNTVSGSVAGLTSLTYINAQGSNTLSGSLDALTSLTAIIALGSNTLSGDVKNISAGITHVNIVGANQIVAYTSGGDWSSISDSGTITINPDTGYGLAEAEVDLLIQEIESTRTASRAIDVTLQGSNAARSAASDAAVAALIADGGSVTTN